MKSILSLLLISILSSVKADQYYSISESWDSSKTDVAIIWVPASETSVDNYQSIADSVQQAGSESGKLNMCVGVADFYFSKPDPLKIDGQAKSIVEGCQSQAGFSGDNIFIVGHGLGGVVSQQYAESTKDTAQQIKGSILTGSVLLRDYHSINAEGKSVFTITKPTLTLLGTLDGQMRVTRGAEQYWHEDINIVDSQKDQYQLELLDGLSHWSFASGDMPSYVTSNDFMAELSESSAHDLISSKIVSYIQSLALGGSHKYQVDSFTSTFYAPMIEAMELEGSYYMKPACYNSTMTNDDIPTCLAGSPWVVTAHEMMADYSSWTNPLIKFESQDNFHRAYSLFPYHHPEISNTCEQDTTEECTVQVISVTENLYTTMNELDTGRYQISAIDHKAKLLGREAILLAAGNTDVDFHETDEVGNRCGEINQAALDWAANKADKDAYARYQSLGEKMVIGDDTGPYNNGPQWIWYEVEEDENSDKTEMTFKSPTMVFSAEFIISASAGIHFCKLISPFTAMEWIYVDSLYAHNTPETYQAQEMFLQ